MVGTIAFTKYIKVNHNNDTLEGESRGDLENPDSWTHHPLHEQDHIQIPSKLRRRYKKSNDFHGIFGILYMMGLFLLVSLSAFTAACVIRKLFSSTTSDNKDLPSKIAVLIFDGQKESLIWPEPPPHEDYAAVARYVLHISEWGSLSTYSTHKDIKGYPFVNVFSVSDGPVENSTGVPYFYFTQLELSVKDMEVSNNVSFTVSEAQSDYCSKKRYDPEDPRCAHVIFTGSMNKVEKGSAEEEFARTALFSRHEEMPSWPSDHKWYFAKLDIVHIYVLDYFGGANVVPVEEYFATNPFKV